jgi:hypothetical protein
MIDRLCAAHPEIPRENIMGMVHYIINRMSGRLRWTMELPQEQHDALVEFIFEETL